MLNAKGIDVQVGRWYDFYSLQSGMATDVKKVTGFVLNDNGTCDIVRVQGLSWYDQSTRWVNYPAVKDRLVFWRDG